jgi:hypothetical protein
LVFTSPGGCEIFGDPPPLNVSGKGNNQFQILRKAREITNANAAKQKPEPTPRQKQKRGRPTASARQERPPTSSARPPLEGPASAAAQIIILRPIIRIMLKALSMFVF